MSRHESDSVKTQDSLPAQKPNADDALINKIAATNLKGVASGNKQLLNFDKAPENALTRYGLVTVEGLSKVPAGILKETGEKLSHPLQIAETLGTGAGMAVVLKTILPEGGMAGKLAGAAIGAYFTYKSAEPIFDAYKMAGKAGTMHELHDASSLVGDAGGAFIIDSAIAAGGYKLGSHYTDRVLSSRSFDGFADAKASFYEKLGQSGSRLKSSLGFGSGLDSRSYGSPQSVAGASLDSAIKFLPSERSTPPGFFRGEADAASPMEVSIMLKSKASDLRMNRTLARIAEGRQSALGDAEMAEQFGASPGSLEAVKTFAEQNGLSLSEANLSSGRVVLSGKSGQFSEAFRTRLSEYEHPSGLTFRGREGSLTIPKELEKHIVGIMGMDDRPQARSHAVKFTGPVPDETLTAAAEPSPTKSPSEEAPDIDTRAKRGFMPNEVADAYNFPKDSLGKDQSVAIIELGGGIDLADNARYYEQHGLPQPKRINIIEMEGAKNSPGGDADGEVLLDSQIIGAIAPEATQNLIFAPNSEKGFIDAITRSAFPEKGETQNSVISISWGQNEAGWTRQAIDGMNLAFKKAALKGISIFAASGDDGSTDNGGRGKVLVDYPASDPYVTGAGGTRLTVDGEGKLKSEVVWNNNRANDAGGGGVSQLFPLPDFQKDVGVPVHAKTAQPGRGVPDVAGNADPVTGYRIRVGGAESITGGTSAVSPLDSALMLRINGALKKPFSAPLNQWLYKNATSGIFNDITSGDNGAYKAGPGWDATTGLGSIDGSKMFELIKREPFITPSFGNYRFVGPTNPDSDSSRNR